MIKLLASIWLAGRADLTLNKVEQQRDAQNPHIGSTKRSFAKVSGQLAFLFVIYFVDLPRVPARILQGGKLRSAVGQVKSGVTISI
jgi:hypothetical protein